MLQLGRRALELRLALALSFTRGVPRVLETCVIKKVAWGERK